MCTLENIMSYHCPRWEELPQIDLYMDQLLSVLENYLEIFSEDDSKIITPAMVNNYVKQKIIKPPVNKKYNKKHISFLYIICILKRLMGLTEIYDTKEKLLEHFSMDEAYNMFCNIFEESLRTTFDSGYQSRQTENNDMKEIIIVRAVNKSFANILYARYLISTIEKPIVNNKSKK